MTSESTADEVVAEIAIHVSAERIFDALTDPLQRVKWWGAEDKFQTTEMESDLRPGGTWQMRGIDSEDKPFTLRGAYLTISRPSTLEFTWITDRDEPLTIVRFDLTEKDGTTTVRMTHSGFAGDVARERYRGWPWLLAMLRKHAETSTQGNTE